MASVELQERREVGAAHSAGQVASAPPIQEVRVKLGRGRYTFGSAAIARSSLLLSFAECANGGPRPRLPLRRRAVWLWDRLDWLERDLHTRRDRCLGLDDLLGVIVVSTPLKWHCRW